MQSTNASVYPTKALGGGQNGGSDGGFQKVLPHRKRTGISSFGFSVPREGRADKEMVDRMVQVGANIASAVCDFPKEARCPKVWEQTSYRGLRVWAASLVDYRTFPMGVSSSVAVAGLPPGAVLVENYSSGPRDLGFYLHFRGEQAVKRAYTLLEAGALMVGEASYVVDARASQGFGLGCGPGNTLLCFRGTDQVLIDERTVSIFLEGLSVYFPGQDPGLQQIYCQGLGCNGARDPRQTSASLPDAGMGVFAVIATPAGGFPRIPNQLLLPRGLGILTVTQGEMPWYPPPPLPVVIQTTQGEASQVPKSGMGVAQGGLEGGAECVSTPGGKKGGKKGGKGAPSTGGAGGAGVQASARNGETLAQVAMDREVEARKASEERAAAEQLRVQRQQLHQQVAGQMVLRQQAADLAELFARKGGATSGTQAPRLAAGGMGWQGPEMGGGGRGGRRGLLSFL